MNRKVVTFIKKSNLIYIPSYWMYIHCLNMRNCICKYIHRERRYTYGEEHPDKIFYVIGAHYATAGLFAIVKSVFCHICYAVQHGYFPVVDMQNFKSQLTDVSCEKKTNAWEMYFLQPEGYTLNDISKGKNVIRSSSLPFPEGIEIGFGTILDDAFHEKYSPLFEKYIQPNVKVKAYAQKKFQDVVGAKKNVLGVLCRGTDYTDSKPTGHPIQPTAHQAVEKAREVMMMHSYEYIFLATEDQRIFNVFEEAFGDKLLYSGQKLYGGMEGKKFLSEIKVSDYSEKWRNTVDYYSTIYILSRCDGFLAGLTCGSICAYIMSKGFKYKYFWDLGMYE